MIPSKIPYIIAPFFQQFVENDLLPGLDISPEDFWQTLQELIEGFSHRQTLLLEKRYSLQKQIDHWHRKYAGQKRQDYAQFLRNIGYIVPEGEDFEIETENVDPEIALVPGPQLVVPITNARYALNAANARYGSLYDALYGTDAMGSLPDAEETAINPQRSQEVFDWTLGWLDETFHLQGASHKQATGYTLRDQCLYVKTPEGEVPLQNAAQLKGYTGKPDAPESIVLQNHALHVLLHIDPSHPIGALHPSGLKDIELEAALSVIMDLEDSITAVDAREKVAAYSNMLGLLRGDLSVDFTKRGRSVTRRLHEDKVFTNLDGEEERLKSRALLWIRNVGHQMTNPTVRDCKGVETYEGLLDALVTVVAGLHDIHYNRANSVFGSIYVVKPKMHGPEEAELTRDIFLFLEHKFDLPPHTVKIGIMDEERRTSVNLKECIRAVKSRLAFINTGFLDRTGDEIHTAMHAGPFPPKAAIKKREWIAAYEARNVEIGVKCGLPGRAQIGKGMWAMPDLMAEMLRAKIVHPQAGANCAWVPSPTAAILHALHYHQVDVRALQQKLAQQTPPSRLRDLLEVPMLTQKNLSAEEIRNECENNAQGILGYVVRWVDQGIGCSKVPDINDVGLMEDRATCRISAQLMANWLLHDFVSPQLMMDVMKHMAAVVDEQNADDENYTPMAPNFDGFAFQAAVALVFQGADLPSGYTEPILHTYRRYHNTQKPNIQRMVTTEPPL